MDDPTDTLESQDPAAAETPTPPTFHLPSIDKTLLLSGQSYTHHSPIPPSILASPTTECVLGVDEAGRGPVLGPMVYALYYLPLPLHRPLLAETHRFDDSKVLTPAFRSELMEKISTPGTDLHENGGWGVRVMSARDISAAQLKPSAVNLNVQAVEATVQLIQDVLDKGVCVTEVYIDTIGPPAAYQKKLEKIFPAQRITVAKKADSLYPCVSAASVCAKVTRDAALDVLYTSYTNASSESESEKHELAAWGSGYPSDARCTTWMKGHMDPVFGWGSECRFSWGTAKEMMEAKGAGAARAEWPEVGEGEADNMKMTAFMMGGEEERVDELGGWFGRRVGEEVF